MIRLTYEISGILVALLMGLYAFRYLTSLYKFFFYQLIAYILTYMLSYVVLAFPSINLYPGSNQWLFNLDMPIETGLLVWPVYLYYKSSRERLLILLGYLIFLGILLSEIIVEGLRVFANYGAVAESILLLILYLIVAYSQFRWENNPWKSAPLIWVSVGILIYFVGTVPYLSLMHFLNLHYRILSYYLYNVITVGLSNLRYIMLAIGFWFIRHNAQSSGINE